MSAAGNTPQYLTDTGEPARDRAAVLAVWRGNLGQDAKMAAKYDWFYLRSPSGAPLLQLLRHAGTPEPVGVCAAGRRRLLHREHTLSAGVLVDLAVVPEHRSLGPALILQQGLFASGREQLDLLYGFPNPKAAPVFKRIGYRHLADMIRYVRVVRHAGYLRRKLPGALAAPAGLLVDLAHRFRDTLRWPQARNLRAVWHDRAPDIEGLWLSSPKPDALTSVRDAGHLRWRFDEAPDTTFRHLVLHDQDLPLAWFATRSDGQTLHVHDFWTRTGGAQLQPALAAALLRAARASGHAAVSVELATDAERLTGWQALGFVERSRRPVFGSWHAAGDMPVLHLTSADEDE